MFDYPFDQPYWLFILVSCQRHGPLVKFDFTPSFAPDRVRPGSPVPPRKSGLDQRQLAFP